MSFRLTLLAALLCAATVPLHARPGAMTPAPDATDPRWAWDLTRIYPSDAAWNAERLEVAGAIPALAAARGTLGRDAAALRTALDAQSAVWQRLQRLWVYASTQQSTDARAPRNQERSRLMSSLWGQIAAAVAWTDPEIQALGAAKVDEYLRAEPGLKKHERRLRDTLRLAKHTLAPETEAALAALSPVLGSPTQTRSQLIDYDAAWPSIEIDGRSVKLNDTGYEMARQHADRDVRRRTFETFWKAYGQYEGTLGTLLAARVESGNVNAKLRGHPSAAAASLAQFDIPEQVVRTLVAETNKALPTLHRYFKLRQKLLKLPDLHYHDIYPKMVPSARSYPVQEAAAITLEAMKPMGEEYMGHLRTALSMRTMHVLPADGKRSGAYATGVYGLGTFVFLNHQDTYDSLTTFAHEWGHGIHTILAQRAQPFETASYSLFVAETASITNEALLTQHMLRTARDKSERMFVLDQALERLRASFFRQAMFAEFELQAHDAQQRGEALSGRKFTELYCGLLRKYHGADQGVMTIDPQVCREWAYIPHFHRPFYVYVYATSTAAASQFGQDIAAGKPGVQQTFVNVLKAGSSVPPYQLLKEAGIDLATPAPYQTLVRHMNDILDEMERLAAS